jgi:MFS family permease
MLGGAGLPPPIFTAKNLSMSDEKPHSLRAALRRTNGVAFLFSTTTALFLLFPVYLQQTGSSAAQIGLVAGLMRVSMLIARPVAGRLLDRFGRRPVIAAGGIVAIAAILSIFLFPKVGPLFLVLRVVQGAAVALVDSGLGTVVADLAPPMLRTRVFALYTVWLTLPGGIMPGVGEAIARHAGFFPLFGAAALTLAGALLIFKRLPETMPPVPEHVVATWSLGRAGAPVLVGGTIVGFVFGVSSVFIPVAPIAEAPGRVGAFFFAYFVGLFGMRLANGIGVPWLARPVILIPAYAFMAIGLAILPLGNSVLLLVAVGLACGMGHGTVVPILYSLLLFGVSKERRGWAVASLAASFDTGMILSTLGLGVVADWTGYQGIFWLSAGIVAAGATTSYLLGRR